MKRTTLAFLFIMLSVPCWSQNKANVKEYPHFLVSKLVMKIGNSAYNGTGFILQDSFLITNAHNVYDKDSLIIIPAHSPGAAPYGKIRIACKRGLNVFIPQEFDSEDISETYDFAIVKLPPCATLNRLREDSKDQEVVIGSITNGEELNIAGYPVYHWFEFKRENGDIQLTNSTSEYSLVNDASLINYRMNTRGGNSGSPLWVIRNNRIILVGIHKSGSGRHNQGVLYNDARKQIIQGFMR